MRRMVQVFGILLLLLLMPFYSLADSLPRSIGPLRLEQLRSGDEARLEIDQLHGKAMSFQKGFIGFYAGEKGSGKLWVSEYASAEEAANALGRMARGMQMRKDGDFWHFQEKQIEGMPVYFVVGMGQTHYFFQKGTKVIWLAVDASVAKETISDAIKKIP